LNTILPIVAGLIVAVLLVLALFIHKQREETDDQDVPATYEQFLEQQNAQNNGFNNPNYNEPSDDGGYINTYETPIEQDNDYGLVNYSQVEHSIETTYNSVANSQQEIVYYETPIRNSAGQLYDLATENETEDTSELYDMASNNVFYESADEQTGVYDNVIN